MEISGESTRSLWFSIPPNPAQPAQSEHDPPIYPLWVDTLKRPELVSSLTLHACEQEPSAAWVLKVGRDVTYFPLGLFVLTAGTPSVSCWTKELGELGRQGE